MSTLASLSEEQNVDLKWHEWDDHGGACAWDEDHSDGYLLIRHAGGANQCVQVHKYDLVPFLHALMAAAKDAGVL